MYAAIIFPLSILDDPAYRQPYLSLTPFLLQQAPFPPPTSFPPRWILQIFEQQQIIKELVTKPRISIRASNLFSPPEDPRFLPDSRDVKVMSAPVSVYRPVKTLRNAPLKAHLGLPGQQIF